MTNTDRWRQPIGPNLAVVVDSSLCIVLEMQDPDGSTHRRTLSNCDELTQKVELACVFVRASEDDWYSQQRLKVQRR